MKKSALTWLLFGLCSGYGQTNHALDRFIDRQMDDMTPDEKLGQLNLASSGNPGGVGGAVGQDEAIRKGYLSATGGMDPEAALRAQKSPSRSRGSAPGESKTVAFRIAPSDLKFYDSDLDYVWEPGESLISVGPNSATYSRRQLNKIAS